MKREHYKILVVAGCSAMMLTLVVGCGSTDVVQASQNPTSLPVHRESSNQVHVSRTTTTDSEKSKSIPTPQVILDAPTIWALNTVHVTGRVQHPVGANKVTLWMDLSSGYTVSKISVAIGTDGSFQTNFLLNGGGPETYTFYASYPSGGTVSVQRTISVLPQSGNWPTPLTAARNQAKQMGATLPILEPTWLPQTISFGMISKPYYSLYVAAKSFTYNESIYLTKIPYGINQAKLNLNPVPLLAQISGVQFSTNEAAQKQMMYGVQQVLGGKLPASTVNLGSGLTGITYQGTQNETILWHEGDWTLGVCGPDTMLDPEQAKNVVNILNSVYLPPTNGLVWIQDIGGSYGGVMGRQVSVSFVEGSDLYSVSSQGIYNALVIASSMKN